MEFSVTISKSSTLNNELEYLFTGSDEVRVQNAMAIPLADIVWNNFGYSGQDRPVSWPAISKGYAEEFHSGDITPTLVLSGALQGVTKIDPSNGEYARVYNDSEYASLHQWGVPGKLHARPFFPLYGDENNSVLTPFAEAEVVAAATAEIERILSGK